MRKILEFPKEVAFHSSCVEEVIKKLTEKNIKILGIEGLREKKLGRGYDLDLGCIITMPDNYLYENSTNKINEGAINFAKHFASEEDLYMLIATEIEIPESIKSYYRNRGVK